MSTVGLLAALVPFVSLPARAMVHTVDNSNPAQCSDVDPNPNWCTIGAAVAAAGIGDMVEVAPGAYVESISVFGTKDVSIVSTGGPGVTSLAPPVDGQLILGVQGDSPTGLASVQLSGFTLSGGNRQGAGFQGGAIWISNIYGVLSISNSVITGNAGYDGGAIANWGTLNISGSLVAGNSAANDGGAIHNSGTLTITDSTIANNSAVNRGGGVHHENSSLGIAHTATITGSTIEGNSAGGTYGGGLNVAGGAVTVSNSTFGGNSANFGGGISASPDNYPVGLGAFPSSVQLNNVTIAQNTTFVHGGGINIDPSATVSIANTAIVDNIPGANTGTADCNGGTLTAEAPSVVGKPSTTPVCEYQLVGDGAVLTGTTNLTTLADNGGTTQTFLPALGTALVDAGSTLTPGSGYPACEAVDQRGIARPEGSACDIGSVEVAQISLQGLIDSANVGDVITVPPGTYSETLTINKAITIRGDGATASDVVIDANGAGRPLTVFGFVDSVIVENLTLTGGFVAFPEFGGGVEVAGGARLTLNGVHIVDNEASSGASGGGIDVYGGVSVEGIFNPSTLTLRNSTVSGNRINQTGTGSGWGAGVFVTDGATASIENSTLSGNIGGAGINVRANSSVDLTHVTVVGNGSGIVADPGFVVGGVPVPAAVVSVINTVSAGNGFSDCQGAFQDTSEGNHVGVIPAGCSLIGDVGTGDPLLGALDESATPTPVHVPSTGSPLIDADGVICAIASDQTGATRPQGAGCDIGAIEVAAAVGALQALIDGAAPGAVVVVPPGTYPESIIIGDGITLRGGGTNATETVIDATGLGQRAVTLSGSATLENLTVTGGESTSQGGNIFNDSADLTLIDVIVANGTALLGGGVFSSGTLTISGSTIVGNTATSGTGTVGGGVGGLGTIVISNSTIQGNDAIGSGGGIGLLSGTATLNNVTIVSNSAEGTGGGFNAEPGAIIRISNSLSAGNTSPGSINCTILESLGHNVLAANPAGCLLLDSDIVDPAAANIGPLANNGGPTPTRALLDGNPALDAGSTRSYPSFDADSIGDWQLNGYAQLNNGELLLAEPASFFTAGSAYLADPIDVTEDFRAEFQFRIDPLNASDGADGITFTVTDSPADLGAGGGYLAIGGAAAPVAGVSVEFDTWVNGTGEGANDASAPDSGNHIGVDVAGSLSSVAFNTAPIADLSDGSVWTARVEYDASTGTIDVYASNTGTLPATPTVSTVLTTDIFTLLDDSVGYVGFTGASGSQGISGSQQVLSFTFESGPACESTDQRGVTRPQGSRCDVGAFELEVTDATVVSGLEVSTGGDTTLESGFPVALGDIPSERLLAGASAIVGAPLGAIELDASVDAAPLGAIGLDATPLGAIPLGAIPLGAIPLGAIPLGAITLMDLPIDGGWDAVLVGTSLAGRPPQTVTVEEFYAEVPADRLTELRLAQLDPTSSAFGDVSVGSLLLGTVPISQLDTDGDLLAACADATNQTSCPGDASPLSLELSGSSLTASPLGAIPLGAIPLGAIPLGAIGTTEAAPLGAIPLGAIPLGAIPLGAIGDIASAPLGAIPLGAIGDLAAAPLGAIPLGAIDVSAAPLGAIPLGAIPLGAIPLGAIPLGAIPLGAIPLGAIGVGGDFCVFNDAAAEAGESCADLGIDPNTTTVSEYVALLGETDVQATPLGAIPLGAIPLGAIPLGAIDLAGVPLGAIPLGAIADLEASPLGAITLGLIGVDPGSVCSSCTEGTTLAEAVTANGGDITATPLGAITLDALPLGAIPLGAIPLGAISVAGVPLGTIPLGAIDLQTSPLGAIQLQDTPLGAIGDTTTLAEAVPLGAIPADTPLGAITDALDGFLLQDVLDHLTIAFLGVTGLEGFDGLTLADVLVGILLASDFPWEDLPLDQIEVRDVACAAIPFDVGEGDIISSQCTGDVDTLDLAVDFVLQSGDLGGLEARVSLPSAWGYLAGSAYLDVGGTLSDIEPTLDGSALAFQFVDSGAPGGSAVSLRLSVYAGYQLGTETVSAIVTGQAGPDLNATSTAISVVDGLEPSSLGSPTSITEDTLYVGYIGASTDVDGFAIPSAGEGVRTTVFLSNLDQDVDTFIYRPESAPLSGDGTERQIPLGSTPVSDGIDFGGDSPLEPEVQGDSPLAAPTGDVLADSSTNTGTNGEELTILDGPTTESYTIQVAGFQGASSDRPYTLRVKRTAEAAEPTTCQPRPYLGLAISGTATIPDGTATVFLTNPGRFDAIYGSGAWGTASAQLAALASRPEVSGIVVDIANIPGVIDAFNAWDADPCDVSAANDIVGAIQVWIQDNAPDSLRHITIMGADEVVPFARAEDETVVANESTYAGEFDASPLFSALTTRHYLTDAPYGDFDPIPWVGTKYAYVADLSVGRLVENATHIAGAIQTYIDNGGVLSPTTAAVASYDFLYDGATLLADRLDQQLGGAITDRTLMDDPALVIDPNDAWTNSDLGLLIDGVPDIISPNSHYDHHRLLPSQENLNETEANLFTIDDLPSALDEVIVFTMGCHSGLNVDGSIGTATEDRDWPEVYSALNAIYIGNTGYGYGDSATVALTESIMANLAGNLDGTLTIGQALTQAKQDQFSKAGLYGVYDLKAIEEATLYGLPFWQISVPGGGPAAAPDPAAGPTGTDPISGLTAASFSIAPDFDLVTSVNGDYYAVDGEVEYLQWRPIQPRTGVDVTKDGLIATGAIFTDLVTSDNTITDAAFARPMTVSSTQREPEIETPGVVFPTGFTTIGTGNRINPSLTGPAVEQVQRLNLIPGQFQGDPTGSGGTQRLFEQIEGTVFYRPAGDVGVIDWTRPIINAVNASTSGNEVEFTVDTNDPDSSVARVVVLYRSGTSTWTSVDLEQQGTSSIWIGGGLFGAVTPPLDYFVFSVNADGVTSISTFKGGLYETTAGPPPGPDETPISIDGSPGLVSGVYASPVSISGTVGRPATVDGVSGSLPVTVSTDGPHVVAVSDGPTFSFVVDQTDPVVTYPTSPPEYDPGQVVHAPFGCQDETTLITSCAATITSPVGVVFTVSDQDALPTGLPGIYSVSATAMDSAGNESTRTFVYVVRSIPEITSITGPLDPVQINQPVSITVRFSDPGFDAHQTTFGWGDGNFATVPGSSPVSASHTYVAPGVYTVTVTVTDDDGLSITDRYQFVVVFDPNGGFVTGGGWIDSPAGAYPADETLAGKANFGFVSKYKKGSTVPEGDTTFKFKTADLEFESTSYDWLVIAGSRAQFKGSGLINEGLAPNGEEYKFFLVGVDGGWNNGTDPDRFRIKIWYETIDGSGAVTENIFYDNQMDEDADSLAATELGGGSIVIHQPQGKK